MAALRLRPAQARRKMERCLTGIWASRWRRTPSAPTSALARESEVDSGRLSGRIGTSFMAFAPHRMPPILRGKASGAPSSQLIDPPESPAPESHRRRHFACTEHRQPMRTAHAAHGGGRLGGQQQRHHGGSRGVLSHGLPLCEPGLANVPVLSMPIPQRQHRIAAAALL